MTNPSLTFVTTCKGRLKYLRQTLPLLASHSSASCVVVDYGCPDRSGDWVRANLPQVAVVRWPDTGSFSPAHARNLGVAAATTDVVCLIDADVRVAPEFAATVLAHFDPRRYYLAEPLAGDISGTFVCARAAFEFAEGYDEACMGWGGEDLDLYDRLDFHGMQRASFPARLLSALPHPDSERTEHHAMADKILSNSINLLYSHIKLDLMRLSGARLPADYRRTLYAQVRETCIASRAAGRAVRIEIPYADGTINYCGIQTTIAYMIDTSRPDGQRVSAPPAVERRVTSAGAEP